MTCSLEVLNVSGHLTLNWNPDDPQEVESAKAEFEKMKCAGFAFFREDKSVKRIGTSGSLVVKVKDFEPKAKRTVAVRPMRGG